jgi:hypothetical protein
LTRDVAIGAIWLCTLVVQPARAQSTDDEAPAPVADPVEEPVDEPASPEERLPVDTLAPYRLQFDVLADRTIGTTSTPVEFDWRATDVQLGVTGSLPAELNNFNSLRGGALVRLPSGGLVWDLTLGWVEVFDTVSSRQLAFTPYRQPGRPSRIEIDVLAGIPLAEGVVTVAPRWFPAAQLVFNGYLGLRYRLHPTGFRGMRFGQIAGNLLNPTLSEQELDNLEGVRLDAMVTDAERYGLVAGLGNDVYLKPGLFISPRALFSVPLLAPASQTRLLWWGEATLALGFAW